MTSPEEAKIREAFSEKNWQEIKTEDTWQIFKIMSEFVEGFEKMGRIGPCVSIFGSARTKTDNKYYILAEEIAYKLTLSGYGIITGGGPGIMEAGNKGAQRAGGKSVGLNIKLPFEQGANHFIDLDKLITFDYFFVNLWQIHPNFFQAEGAPKKGALSFDTIALKNIYNYRKLMEEIFSNIL